MKVTTAPLSAMPKGIHQNYGVGFEPAHRVYIPVLAKIDGAVLLGEVRYLMGWYPKCCAYALAKNMDVRVSQLYDDVYSVTNTIYLVGKPPDVSTDAYAKDIKRRYLEGDPLLPYLNANAALDKETLTKEELWLYMYGLAANDVVRRSWSGLERVGIVTAANSRSDLHTVTATIAKMLTGLVSVTQSPWMPNARSNRDCAVFTSDARVYKESLRPAYNAEAQRVCSLWHYTQHVLPENLYLQGNYYSAFTIFENKEDLTL